MLELYIKLVQEGIRTIDKVPKKYREQVQDALQEDGISNE